MPHSSSQTFLHKQAAGYQVKLCFLRLPDAEFAISRVAQRVRLGGHHSPQATIRRRFERGWEILQSAYLGIVDEWAIYDASQAPVALMETGDNRTPDKLMEDPVPYRTNTTRPTPVKPLDDPDFIGAEAAFARASAKAIALARAAGLEPIISNSQDSQGSVGVAPASSTSILPSR